MKLYLDNMCFAFGEQTLTVQEAASKGLLKSPAAALIEAGFAEHRVCRDQTSSYDLARAAVQGIADKLGAVDLIAYHTGLPFNSNLGSWERFSDSREIRHLTDYPASYLQADFSLERASVLGVTQQACTGALGMIRICRGLLTAEPSTQRALCVTADRLPHGALYEATYNVLSDGAVGYTLSKEPGAFSLVAAHAITNGAMSLVSSEQAIGSYFNYTHRLIHETLAQADLSIKDVDWIVPQNTARAAWRVLAPLLPFEHERVWLPTLPEVGHMVSGDNLYNLQRQVDLGTFARGDIIVMPTAGYGLNWQCVIVKKE